MSKRTGNRRGKRGRGKHNKQYSHERGRVIAKEILKKERDEAFAKPVVEPKPTPEPMKDPTEGFF